MNYDILKISIGGMQTNDIFPQVKHMGENYTWTAADSVTNITSNQSLNFRPNFKSFHLDDETKLTDIVSQGYINAKGLLVSPSFYDALEGYIVQAHETYPAQVVFHETSYRYCYIHMTENVEESVNYSMSRSSLRLADGTVQSINISSSHDLRRARIEAVKSAGQSLLASVVVFAKRTLHYDLFSLTLTGHVFYVSDRLSADLRKRRLTGFELLPTDTVITFEG